MSILTKQQRRYLREITLQKARVQKQQDAFDQARLVFVEMLKVGHENGISTYNLAKAADLSQTRVYQLIAPTPPPSTDAQP